MIPPLNLAQKQALIAHLKPMISDNRLQRFEEVLEQRIGHMHIVLEDIYQAHNASAVLRSVDCFGIQNVHLIENKNHYKVSDDVALGASQWLSIHRHKNTKATLQAFKQQDYKIAATTPHQNDKTIYDFDISQKFMLVFGTEKEGISNEVLEAADEFIKIPMYGFTESFNISVCAAMCMNEFSNKIRKQVPNPYLSEDEKQDIYIQWLLQSIRKSEVVLKDFLKKQTDF
ncbi:MAG: RNA methyltransferase [Bacteroidetes bacterium]|nr:RNA methyltransferase [Bacteroidota bacterium]